jgi:quinol monooxygenase YgiN
MADGVIHVLPEQVDVNTYEQVNEKLNAQGDPPSALRFHAAGRADDGRIRIIEVWDSRADFDQFNEQRLTPAISEVSGMPADQMPQADHTWFAVHNQLTQ